MVNREKPDLWKSDVTRSVDMYNDWFINFAPRAFRESRANATKNVETALKLTKSLTQLRADLLREHAEILPILRMSTCPPIARDRLIGLARVPPNIVKCMEIAGCIPSRMPAVTIKNEVEKIVAIVTAQHRNLEQPLISWGF
jgi:type II restriction enzyme